MTVPYLLADRTGIQRERAFIQFGVLVEDRFALGPVTALFPVIPAPSCGHFCAVFSLLVHGNLHGLVGLAVGAVAFCFLGDIHVEDDLSKNVRVQHGLRLIYFTLF
jgi:hypothetical protein